MGLEILPGKQESNLVRNILLKQILDTDGAVCWNKQK